MSRSDQWIVAICIAGIAVHVTALLLGLITHRLAYFVTVVNSLSALSILLYWAQKQIRIQRHIFEWRETLVLLFEAILLLSSAYSLVMHHRWIKIPQYIIFGIHLLCLLSFTIFLLTFKFKKLF